MIIASHHKWKDADYVPVCDWDDDTLVQWGGRGIVLGSDPYYTAFFEAFPSDKSKAGGFIRGEGSSIEDAERDAFEKFARRSACNHLWGREKYTNGGQMCRYCRAFRSGFVNPIHPLGDWRKPVKYYETWVYEEDIEEGRNMSKYARKLWLRSRVFGVTERPDPTPTASQCPPATRDSKPSAS